MEKVAIIGTGIAGMGCAHHLYNKYDISLFEQNDYIGGHTNTISIDEDGKDVFIDTGFMVFNFETYPNLCRLFKEIKAPIKKTDMSFGVQYKPTNLEYCGTGLNGLFAQRKNVFNISFIKLLSEISRFNKISPEILADPNYEKVTLRQYIHLFGFSDDFLNKYLVPMSSAVWSTPMDKMLDFPIITLVRFFKNHGFLGLNSQHQWYTLENGSQSYRELLIAPFRNKIFCENKVIKVKREIKKVIVHFADGSSLPFDKVIMATHADQALQILDTPYENEKRILGKFKYQKNIATVHYDESVMPKNKRTWSSWNYRIEGIGTNTQASTIYWMNKLQQVSKKKNYFVSINAPEGSLDPKKVLKTIVYEHPLFDMKAIQAQKELSLLNTSGPIYYCGSYFNYGFHEDAYKSAVDLASTLLASKSTPLKTIKEN